MTPVSASLAHIFVPYPGPVALFRTPALNPDPKKVIRAGKLSPFLAISFFPVDLQHVMVKRKPVFSMHLKVGTFFCRTAFVTPPKVDHLLTTNLNREKRPKKTQIFTEGAISTSRATRRSSSDTTYASPCISLHIRVYPMSIGPLVTEISARESTRAERFFAFFTIFAPRF